MVKTFRVAICVGVVVFGGLLFAQQTPRPRPCPAEGFSGGFSYGCPQKKFSNPSDILAMIAALPHKPAATPQKPRPGLGFCKAAGWGHTSISLVAEMV